VSLTSVVDVEIQARQLAWTLERALPNILAVVPLHTAMVVQEVIRLGHEGDVRGTNEWLAKMSEEGRTLTHFASRNMIVNEVIESGHVRFLNFLWCAGRRTPRGEIDWMFGGDVNNDGMRLYGELGHRRSGRNELFQKRISAGTLLWRSNGFPLRMADGVIEVQGAEQPALRPRHKWLSQEPLWCAVCDAWSSPSGCPGSHVWYCTRRSCSVTLCAETMACNPGMRFYKPCRAGRCLSCGPSKHGRDARWGGTWPTSSYVPNRGVGSVFW
jgi:hypothetical protein